ncbi:MAG TPA: hypothetical protein VK158_04255 [Acidobacteriota bacterium]|nr:hypothetical protein [Acidobacteriota bacterium]
MHPWTKILANTTLLLYANRLYAPTDEKTGIKYNDQHYAFFDSAPKYIAAFSKTNSANTSTFLKKVMHLYVHRKDISREFNETQTVEPTITNPLAGNCAYAISKHLIESLAPTLLWSPHSIDGTFYARNGIVTPDWNAVTHETIILPEKKVHGEENIECERISDNTFRLISKLSQYTATTPDNTYRFDPCTLGYELEISSQQVTVKKYPYVLSPPNYEHFFVKGDNSICFGSDARFYDLKTSLYQRNDIKQSDLADRLAQSFGHAKRTLIHGYNSRNIIPATGTHALAHRVIQ